MEEKMDSQTALDTTDDNLTNEITEKDEFKGKLKALGEDAAEIAVDAAAIAVEQVHAGVEYAGQFLQKLNDEFRDGQDQKALDKYQPVFLSSLENDNVYFPKYINLVAQYDSKALSKFPDAVGFKKNISETDVLDICLSDVNKYNLIFYPMTGEALYIANPVDGRKYIEISSFLKYMNNARIAELKDIAHSLGATKVAISIMQEISVFQAKKAKAKAKFKIPGLGVGIDADKETQNKEYEQVGATITAKFNKKEPEMPERKIWANDDIIDKLIEHSLSPKGRTKDEQFTVNYNTATGITAKEAVKLDSVIKKLKFSVSGSFAEEIRREEKMKLDCVVSFEE